LTKNNVSNLIVRLSVFKLYIRRHVAILENSR